MTESEKIVDAIRKHHAALSDLCNKLRSRNNLAADLAMKALDTGYEWAVEAAMTRRVDPFELEDDEDAAA